MYRYFYMFLISFFAVLYNTTFCTHDPLLEHLNGQPHIAHIVILGPVVTLIAYKWKSLGWFRYPLALYAIGCLRIMLQASHNIYQDWNNLLIPHLHIDPLS